ncbi:MAG: hypothetical protein IH780_03405 [Thaumarchaeota archaeon]|nr:hypothetical protein [Nitrososphaerota archaeon]
MVSGKFGTAINCIDGRTQAPVSDWIKENHSVDYVDTITEPGCDKVLLEVDYDKIDHIKSKLLISIKAHNSSLIVIAGHHDCAANPVSKEEHLTQIKKSINIIKSWNFPVKVLGVWVNDQWKIEQVDE